MPPFIVGAHAIWRHECRGGYGYVERIDVTVVKVGPKRVQVEANLIRGGTKRVWVSPESLSDPLGIMR